jgi:heptosyltransferase III
MASANPSASRRVLIIFPGALGDLICVLPALRALIRRYRDCSVELVARAELAQFAVGRMGIARGHSIDRREVSLLFNSADDAATQAREFFGAFAAIHSFFGADQSRVREVLPAACLGRVFFHPFRPEAEGHISAAFLRAVEEGSVAADIEADASGLELQPADLDEARRLITDFKAEEGRYVLLMPGSGSPSKNWPAENYLQLARHFKRFIPVLTVLGPAEAGLEATFAEVATITNPSLGTLAGLARMSSAFVGNDSGVSHLAAAAGARGVVIFGPTEPSRWRPLGAVKVLRRMPLRELPWREVAGTVRALQKLAE